MEKFVISVVLAIVLLGNIYASDEESYEEWYARQPADLKLAFQRLDEKGLEFETMDYYDPVVRKEIHQIGCERIREGLDKCIHEKGYKGKFTLSIINPNMAEWDDFYDEIINGESDKTTVTDAEAKTIRDNIYEYITESSISGILKIDHMGKQLFNGWWTMSY